MFSFNDASRRLFAAFCILALAATRAAAGEQPFYAEGVGVITEAKNNRLTFVASGEATLMGEWDLELKIKINGDASRSKGTLVGSGGDEIDIVADSITDFDLPGQVGTFTITGGKGRFKGASGGGTFRAVIINFEPETLVLTLDGTISLKEKRRDCRDK